MPATQIQTQKESPALFLVRQKLNSMTDAELEFAVSAIVASSSTEAEIRRRIAEELGYFDEVDVCLGWPEHEHRFCPPDPSPGFWGNRMKGGQIAAMVLFWRNGKMLVA